MAYAFDKTMGMLGRKGDGGKQDIFGGQGGLGLTDGAPTGSQGSDASGDLTGGGGGTNTGEAVKQSNDTASNAAVSANVGRVKSPANLGTLRQSVDQNKTNLQDKANAYVQQSTGPTALSDDDKNNLRSAVDPEFSVGNRPDKPAVKVGGPQQFAQNSMQHWANQRPESVKAVDPFKTDIDYGNSTIESLGTDAGIQSLLRRSGGAEYSRGDAAFDQALLSQDQGFQQEREGLSRAYGGLQKFGDELGAKTTEAGQLSANDAYGAYLTDMRKNLEGLNTDYTARATGREKMIEDQAQLEVDRLRGTGGDVLNTQLESLRGSPAAGDVGQYLDASGLDPSSYFTQGFDPNAHGWEDYLDQGQAGTFNNIMSLLGKGTTYKTGGKAGGFAGSDLGSFDTNRMQTDLIAKGQKSAAAAAAEKAKADAEAAAAAQQKEIEVGEFNDSAQQKAAGDALDTGMHKFKEVTQPVTNMNEFHDRARTFAADPVREFAAQKNERDTYEKLQKPSVSRSLLKHYMSQRDRW